MISVLNVAKKILFVMFAALTISGCAYPRISIPAIEPPPDPVKPKIHWQVVQHQNEPYIGLKIGDGLALTEYLIRLDVAMRGCRNRIDAMNKLLEKP